VLFSAWLLLYTVPIIMKRTFLVVLLYVAVFVMTPVDVAQAEVSVEDSVRSFFSDIPVMIDIARCESKFRQFSEDGSVLKGGWGGAMVGVFQFYEAVHDGAATAMGFDLGTLEGNLGYAKHLYTVSGTTPWNSAQSCWGSAVTTTSLSPAQLQAMQGRIVSLQKLVKELTILLEKQKQLSLR